MGVVSKAGYGITSEKSRNWIKSTYSDTRHRVWTMKLKAPLHGYLCRLRTVALFVKGKLCHESVSIWRRGSESNENSPTTNLKILNYKAILKLILYGFKRFRTLSTHYRLYHATRPVFTRLLKQSLKVMNPDESNCKPEVQEVSQD